MRKTALVIQYLEQLWRVIPLLTRHLRREGSDMQGPLRGLSGRNEIDAK